MVCPSLLTPPTRYAARSAPLFPGRCCSVVAKRVQCSHRLHARPSSSQSRLPVLSCLFCLLQSCGLQSAPQAQSQLRSDRSAQHEMTEQILSLKLTQLSSACSSIEALLSGLARSKRPELDLFEIAKILRSAQNALDAAAIELAQPSCSIAAARKAEITAELREHKRTLKELKNEYEIARIAADRKALVQGATPSASSSAAAASSASASALMSHGLSVQQRDLHSLQSMVRTIHEAKEIGIDVHEKLQSQSGQIAGVHEQLHSIDSTLTRSTKVIKRISRRIASDK